MVCMGRAVREAGAGPGPAAGPARNRTVPHLPSIGFLVSAGILRTHRKRNCRDGGCAWSARPASFLCLTDSIARGWRPSACFLLQPLVKFLAL